MESEWLTAKETAAYLQVHRKTLYRYVRKGLLRQYSIPGSRQSRFRKREVESAFQLAPYLEGQGRPLLGAGTLASPAEPRGEDLNADADAFQAKLGRVFEDADLPHPLRVVARRLTLQAAEGVCRALRAGFLEGMDDESEAEEADG